MTVISSSVILLALASSDPDTRYWLWADSASGHLSLWPASQHISSHCQPMSGTQWHRHIGVNCMLFLARFTNLQTHWPIPLALASMSAYARVAQWWHVAVKSRIELTLKRRPSVRFQLWPPDITFKPWEREDSQHGWRREAWVHERERERERGARAAQAQAAVVAIETDEEWNRSKGTKIRNGHR